MKEHCSAKTCQLWEGSGPTVAGGAAARSVPKTETVFRYTWVFTSLRQIGRWCADFVLFHNRDRPHGSYGGLTPDEVAAGAKEPSPPRGQVTYFDGKMKWYAFG